MSFHESDNCEFCSKLGKKIVGGPPEEIPMTDFFMWLKKYNDEKSIRPFI